MESTIAFLDAWKSLQKRRGGEIWMRNNEAYEYVLSKIEAIHVPYS